MKPLFHLNLCAGLFCASLPASLPSQNSILLANPSFEGNPACCTVPEGWSACSSEKFSFTPVDIQPGSYECQTSPAHGSTYLGLVARLDGSWEGVSQELPSPLQPGVCYQFTVSLAQSPRYASVASPDDLKLIYNTTQNIVALIDYTSPTVLQIWGGYSPCEPLVFLSETPVIDHHDWRSYRIVMGHREEQALTHLLIQVFQAPGYRCTPKAGHILVDELSAITPIECPMPLVKYDSLALDGVQYIPAGVFSRQTIDSLLSISLEQIEFAGNRLKEPCYEHPVTGLPEWRNLPLRRVAQMLKLSPDVKLTIQVKGSNKTERADRAQYLRRRLEQWGVPSGQLEIGPFVSAKKGAEDTWRLKTSWLRARW